MLKGFCTLAAACALALSATVEVSSAQARGRRTTTTTQRRRAPGTASSSRLGSTQANAARIRLADQVKNLTRFLYLYGRLSKDLELTGAQAESNEVAGKTRTALLTNLGNVRQGLDQLEAQFRLTGGLAPHYAKLAGVARRAADAETKAAAGQFDQAGRSLVEVVNQLTDVLLEM